MLKVLSYLITTGMRRLTTGVCPEECVVVRTSYSELTQIKKLQYGLLNTKDIRYSLLLLGLIAYIKQVYKCGGECLQRGTYWLLIQSRFITMVGSVYGAVRTDCLYKADYIPSVKGKQWLYFHVLQCPVAVHSHNGPWHSVLRAPPITSQLQSFWSGKKTRGESRQGAVACATPISLRHRLQGSRRQYLLVSVWGFFDWGYILSIFSLFR
jgi:hypothetical protein